MPRRVFAAVEDPEAGCDGMRRDLCEALDLVPEPGWRPHVTVCRPLPANARDLPLFRDWPHLLEAHGQAEWGPCVVSDVVLWREAAAGAARYEAVTAWPLG